MFCPCDVARGLATCDGGWTGRADGDERRAFRFVLLFAVVFVCSAFDLGFTLAQWERGNFLEANALAATVGGGPGAVVTYKAALVGVGATILYSLRRRWESEAGLWLVAACHVGLMAWWVLYLDTLEVCLCDPAVTGPLGAF